MARQVTFLTGDDAQPLPKPRPLIVKTMPRADWSLFWSHVAFVAVMNEIQLLQLQGWVPVEAWRKIVAFVEG